MLLLINNVLLLYIDYKEENGVRRLDIHIKGPLIEGRLSNHKS